MPFLPSRSALCVSIGLASLLASVKADAAPRGTFQWAPPERIHLDATRGISSNIIFLNRCQGGCTIMPGFEDSRRNTSSIVDETSFIDEFPYGDAAWDAVVDCVRELYEPYNVVITDEDPGGQAHFETIVAGDPSDIGQPPEVGGIAPFNCGVIDNAITFNFAELWSDMRALCETIGQETAHAFGLDHEYLCEDPMTYLIGCGDKYFRDVDAECGEYQPRECLCGGYTQNSHQVLLRTFEPTGPTPPILEIVRPRANQMVEPGFPVEVSARDNVSVHSVEVFLNGASIGQTARGPYVFNAPAELPPGELSLRVVALDNRGDGSEKTIRLTQPIACASAGDCGSDQVCLSAVCLDGPEHTGGLGTNCTDNGDCQTGMCGDDGEDQYCASLCDDGECPAGFDCLGGGAAALCWPRRDDGGCDSAPGGRGLLGPGALVLLGFLIAAGRRRPAYRTTTRRG